MKNAKQADTKFTGQYASTVMATIYSAYRPFFFRMSLALGVGFIGRICLLANANVIGYWVDSFCHDSPNCHPVPHFFSNWDSGHYIGFLAILASFGFLLTGIFRVGFSRLSAHAVSQIYDDVTLRTSRFPMSFFDNTPAGRIITRFSSDYGNVFRLFGGPLAELISIIFDLTCMVFLVSVASLYYLPLVVLIAGLNYFIYRLNKETLRKERRELSASRAPSIAHFAETSVGASTIRTFLRYQSFFKRFKGLNNDFLNQKLKTQRVILLFSFQMNVMTGFLLLVTGIAAYVLIQRGLMSVGSLGVAFSFIALSGNTIQMFFEWMAQFEEAMVGMERLDQYIRKDIEKGLFLPSSAKIPTDHPKYTREVEKHLAQSNLVKDANASVQVENLWFRYAENLPWVLKDINFTVQKGERLGVIGRTGSGKSSLIQALFYLYPIDRGAVSIDDWQPRLEKNQKGDRLTDLDLYRQAIALISQDPILFKGTLRENLSLKSDLSDEKLVQALERVGLKEWYLEQSEGLEKIIEERGRNVSQGEKQLICMARCLLQNSPVIIMDEATSSVDPHSEEILVKATQDFFAEKTQIIVAHRLSTLRDCHRILWLQDGKMQMLGKPDEVLPIFEKTKLSHT